MTRTMVSKILQSRTYPEQAYRSCLGILRLADRYSKQRLELACARAIHFEAVSFKSVKSILETGLDREVLAAEASSEIHSLVHENVRGAAYYCEKEGTDASPAND